MRKVEAYSYDISGNPPKHFYNSDGNPYVKLLNLTRKEHWLLVLVLESITDKKVEELLKSSACPYTRNMTVNEAQDILGHIWWILLDLMIRLEKEKQLKEKNTNKTQVDKKQRW